MIGSFATSKAGHDKDTLYVIVDEQGDYVYLCDGRLRPVEKPKKKRLKHIQPINCKVEDTLLARLKGHGKVTNEEVKYAIKHLKKDF
jgi:ribosomal protein L14E/L6E/L27E